MRFGPARVLALILTGTVLVLALIGNAGAADFVRNGVLSAGSGANPAFWQHQSWINNPGVTKFEWQPGAQGELKITNVRPNDARWVQHLHLGPGWYHFTAQLATQDVGAGNTGASLCLLQNWVSSPDLHGTNDWQRVGFYLKVGKDGADVDLACRLGGYSSVNSGSVECRQIEAVSISAPPANESHTYDLAAIKAAQTPPPNGGGPDRSLALLALGIPLLLFVIGWRHRRLNAETKPRTKRKSSRSLAQALHSRREIEIALFVVTLLSFAYFYQASDHSTASRFDLVRSLTERGTVWIDWYAGFNTADIVQMHSHIYSNKAPGGALTGIIPWLLVTGPMRLAMHPGPWFWAIATYLATILSVSLISALGAALTYRVALRMGASEARAVVVALVLAFGTIMFPYATEFTSEPISAYCVLAAFYILLIHQPDDPLWIPLLAGLLAGWATLCDYPTAILSAAVGGYAVWKIRDRRKLGIFAAGAAAIAVLLAVYNTLAFGNPLFLSYEAYMLPGSDRFKAQAVGFAGVTYPHLKILWNVLLAPQRGLFFCNPVLLLVIPGLYFFWRHRALRAEFILIALSIIAFVLFNGSYGDSVVYWGGGTATGPRHIVSVLPFMALTLLFLPASFDYPLGILALVSVFFMLMATAVEPHLPYEYANPLRDFLWPAYLRGDMGYNKGTYYGGPPLIGDSAAFNAGKLIGLPGALQLIPLLGIWLAAGWYLLREIRPPAVLARRAPALIAAGALSLIFIPPIYGALFMRPDLTRPHGLLGRYYEGMEPGLYPFHFERIDRRIDFNSIRQMGSMPYPSTVAWSGQIYAPTTGLYRFMIEADDNGWLEIDGRPVIRDPGNITRMIDEGSTYLNAGWHQIHLYQRNIWGEASMHFFWQPPGGIQMEVPTDYLRPGPINRGRG